MVYIRSDLMYTVIFVKDYVELDLVYRKDQYEYHNGEGFKDPSEGRLRIEYVFMVNVCAVQHLVTT